MSELLSAGTHAPGAARSRRLATVFVLTESSRLPFVLSVPGVGADPDAWRLLTAGQQTAQTGMYQLVANARLPGSRACFCRDGAHAVVGACLCDERDWCGRRGCVRRPCDDPSATHLDSVNCGASCDPRRLPLTGHVHGPCMGIHRSAHRFGFAGTDAVDLGRCRSRDGGRVSPLRACHRRHLLGRARFVPRANSHLGARSGSCRSGRDCLMDCASTYLWKLDFVRRRGARSLGCRSRARHDAGVGLAGHDCCIGGFGGGALSVVAWSTTNRTGSSMDVGCNWRTVQLAMFARLPPLTPAI